MLWRGPMGGGAASGKIGAMIASHCAQGQYLKHRVKCVNPRTSQQGPTRNALRQLASQWLQNLDDAQRAAWATYAANVSWLNRLGDTVHLSGQMEFIRSNWLRQLGGVPFVYDAPVTFNRGSVGPAPTLTMGLGENQFTLTVDPASPWLDGDTATQLQVYLGIPRSQGRTFIPRRTRFVDIVPGTAAGSVHLFSIPWQPLPDYNQTWKAWVLASFSDGRLTTPVPTNTVSFGPPPPPSWIEEFAYADGNLWGNDSWSTTGVFGLNDPQIVSQVLTCDNNTGTEGLCTSAAITTDFSTPWTSEIDLSITPNTDQAVTIQFAWGDVLGTHARLVLHWNVGDEALNRIGLITLGVFPGTDATFANVPFTASSSHTLTVHYDGTDLTLTIDAGLIGSHTITIPSGPSQFTMFNQVNNSPDTIAITRFRISPY
jgi:hypothetical protein